MPIITYSQAVYTSQNDLKLEYELYKYLPPLGLFLLKGQFHSLSSPNIGRLLHQLSLVIE